MVLTIDEKIDSERIEQFASQIEHVPAGVKAWFQETFNGSHPKEFYEGLLSAYANMHVMVHGMEEKNVKEYTGPLVAFVAQHLQKLQEHES